MFSTLRREKCSALKTFECRPNYRAPAQDRNGFFEYDGTVNHYHIWDFKASLMMAACSKDKFPWTVYLFVDSLTGEAFDIARRIGTEVLTHPDRSGIKQLRDEIRVHIFPDFEEEA